jgi:hypothetical protein
MPGDVVELVKAISGIVSVPNVTWTIPATVPEAMACAFGTNEMKPLSLRLARIAYAFQMPVISAATSAEHIDV